LRSVERILCGRNERRTDKKGSAMQNARRIVADFSLAAAAAALIGVAVGGAALSFVWVVNVLSR
jgi:hypothetical protein